MQTARLLLVRNAHALSAAVAIVLVLATATMVPLKVVAQDATTFDVSVPSVEELSGLTAVVANSGDGVNVRADATADADIVTTLSDGMVVDLRIDEVDTVSDGDTRWWPVRVDGEDGWISGAYLAATDGESAASEDEATDEESGETAAEEVSGDAFELPADSGEDLSGLTAVVANSGDGVNIRAEASADAEILATLSDGDGVTLRLDQVDTVTDDAGTRWWPVSVDGQDGWISGFYLAAGEGESADAEDDGEESGDAPAEDLPEDTFDIAVASVDELGRLTALVSSPDGVNIRAEASGDSEIVGTVPGGDIVELRVDQFDTVTDDAGNRWWPIRFAGAEGWVVGAYLADSGGASPSDEDASEDGDADDVAQDNAQFSTGDYAAATTQSGTGVNIREDASMEAAEIGFIPESAVVRIVDGPKGDGVGNSWYRVDNGDVKGFADGDLLVAAEAPPVEEEEEEAPAAPSGPTGGFINPLGSYAFTQSYGCTGFAFEPFDANVGCNFHNGVDLAAPAYTAIMAADGGTVVAAGWCDCGLGFYAEIDHGNGFATVYGHMAEQPYVGVGQQVNQGDVIGPVGSSGLSTGPHVHFMIKQNGVTVDPSGYIPI